MKVQPLSQETRYAGNRQGRLDAKRREQNSAMMDLESKESVLNEKSCNNDRLQMELRAARAAIGGRESVIYDFAELVSTFSTTLMHSKASSYCDRPNAVWGSTQTAESTLAAFVYELGGWALDAPWWQEQ